jgi:hypothetical protein
MGLGKWIAGALGWAMFGPVCIGHQGRRQDHFSGAVNPAQFLHKELRSAGYWEHRETAAPFFFKHQTIYIIPSALGFILTSTPVRHQIKYNSQYIGIFLHFSFISISFA